MRIARAAGVLGSVLFLGCGGEASVRSTGGTGSTSQADAVQSTLLVHYPTGWGNRITVQCGDGAGFNWGTSLTATWTQGDVWQLPLALTTAVHCKPLFNDQTWAIGPNWTLNPGQTLDLWPFFFHTTGSIQQISNWYSNVLNNSRGIWIYTPPSYVENPNERYPVVYMHDGQNLFYDEDSFSGVSWNVGGAMDQGANDGSIHEAIIIGIDNTANRISELTPVADPQYGGGGAQGYLSFMVSELKPQMDSSLRTFGDPNHTYTVGSSLGGLFSVWAGMARPDVFTGVGGLSPSTWWDNEWLLTQSQQARGPFPSRVYIDSGNAGSSNDGVDQTAQLAQAWQQKPGVAVDYRVQDGATHTELYWRQRVPGTLAFLLGPR